MPKLDYIITTSRGCVPYVVDTGKAFFNRIWKVYLDDMLFKDSFYDRNGKCPLKVFIGCSNEVAVGFRGRPPVLVSKRGNYKLTQEKYKDVLEAMECQLFADFGTGKLVLDQKDAVEPESLEDFNRLIEGSQALFGTQFVNNLTEDGMMLYIDEGRLCSKHLRETDFEYQKYLLSINEMNVYSFISENNYRVLHEYVEMKNKNK